MARPHYSSRLEDWFNVGLQAVLRRRGWQERIIPQVGYGACQVVSNTSTPAPTVLHEMPVAHALAEIG